ncbi:MAG: LysR family transcriptional regulator, partial [Yoonia sp.]|uniref:LysR family transcriptional regulator n=1 Tax=Yoonia sp. TaxID=2212373 RepID=UPI003EF8B5F6
MKLQQLRYFVAVYEEGSFSAAAARVNATQSGLSMHVSQMEKRYDVILFERNSSGVTPTETGNSLYKDAVKVLAVASNAEDKLRYLSGAVVGHISVGLMPTFTRSVLTNALLRFSEDYPDVRVTISEAYSGDLSEAVSAGKLDFAVVPSINLNSFLLGTPMGRDQECFVCAAGSHPSVGPVARLKELPPQRFIVPSRLNTRRERIDNYLSQNGIEAREVLEIDTMYGT